MRLHDSHRSSSYQPNHVSIGRQTNHIPNFLSKCDGILCWHLSPLRCSGFSSVIWEVLTSVLVDEWWTLDHWFGHFTIWIVCPPLHVDLRWTLIRWSSWLPGRVLLPVTSPFVWPNLGVSPTFFSSAKCGGLPTSFNHDYLHSCNMSSAPHYNANLRFAEPKDLQPTISTPLSTLDLQPNNCFLSF